MSSPIVTKICIHTYSMTSVKLLIKLLNVYHNTFHSKTNIKDYYPFFNAQQLKYDITTDHLVC